MKQVIFIFLLATAVGVHGQAAAGVCTLKKPPVFRGLRLGMPFKKFISHFPGLRPINMFSREQLAMYPKFRGLEMIVFTALHGDIDFLEVGYGDMAASPNVRQFASAVAEEWQLPHDAWRFTPTAAVMNCPKFRIDVSPGTVKIRDLAAEKEWQEMRRKAESSNP
jgi:hypothetical protein